MPQLRSLFLLLLLLAAPLRADVKLPMHGDVLRVVVVGDVGDGSDEVARGIGRVHDTTPIDAIILPGDNIYPRGVQSETDPRWALLVPLSAVGVPIFPVLGNHDWAGDPDAQIRATGIIPRWQFPAKEYTVQSPVAVFAMIDTTPWANGRGSIPTPAPLLGDRDGRWRIVVGHHPVISSGYHGHFPRGEHRRMVQLDKPLRSAHVDLYVCGHDHHLELIDGKPRFLISGAGSDPIPAVALHLHTVWPETIKRQKGFALVELTKETMSISFYDAAGKLLGGPFRYAH